METLENKLGYHFRNRALLEIATNHSSYANEHRNLQLSSNERLEFLGDSVLGLIIAEFLYKTYRNYPEGDLTRLRATLVCEQHLYEVAKGLNLGSYLKLGKGEEIGGGRERQSILADATEAVFAAIYLDGGMESAREVIHRIVLNKAITGEWRDHKTALQEIVQRRNGQSLTYHMVDETGPDHKKVFRFKVCLNGECIGEGCGRSKKEAEQDAARSALEKMEAE